MEAEIPKVYSPDTIEPRWARAWVEGKVYRPNGDPKRPRFCLVIPPPNITGSLHMGHMLEHTEIDILIRWRRMRGQDVLWLPGTDHASIATQMIVERELGREALPALEPGPESESAWRREGQRRRRAMGPEKFVERCWKWKEDSGGTIRKQMERLGTSCDWTRDRFTMDPAYSRAVQEVFIRLYEEGLIYRGKYIVNWCPRCGTAVSELEVIHEERQGKLWSIRYPFEDGSGHLTVATTRPETMLGDTAVAVNPSDDRYRTTVGRKVILPLLGRIVPVMADSFVNPQFGTGAVKVTPAHDSNDFEIAERHNLPRVVVIDAEARMTDEAGPYRGLDRYEARKRVIEDLRMQGLLEKEENYTLSLGICQRCKAVVEPLLSTQWFMKMKPLADAAIRVVEDGRIRIVPENYRKIYLDWMENIHDWCISRQLWWGHRIPVWYCDACGEAVAARRAPAGCPKCYASTLRAETDVLDTWFSSALWPFATLGWPEETEDLRRYYPNDLMIMGFDILFFWGARMIMMGMKFMNDVPFRELYIHALVRDTEKQKMSKTKGNVIDPLEVTEKYGTDAVRFALAISAAPGTDIAFSTEKIESYRAFANKIWNAGRFILMNLRKLPGPLKDHLAAALTPIPGVGLEPMAGCDSLALVDRWIFSRLHAVTRGMNEALAAYRFHEAAHLIYHFFWHEFCDWYLEWVKPEITKTPEGGKVPAAWVNLSRVFEASLRLLHPFMPFITEELGHQLPGDRRDRSISLEAFSLVRERVADPVTEKQFEMIRELIVVARNAKAERGLHKQKPSAQVASEDLRRLELFRAHQETILRLAGLQALTFSRGHLAAGLSGTAVTPSFDLRLLHEEKVDHSAERSRLQKEKEKLEVAIAQLKKQLGNEEFLSRAPRDVVRGAEHRQAELFDHYRKVLESLERLGWTVRGAATRPSTSASLDSLGLSDSERRALVARALEEDLGAGDLTTRLTVPQGTKARGTFFSQQALVVAGLPVAAEVFRVLDQACTWEPAVEDGAEVAPRTALATVTGPAEALLSGERVALNFLQHLSGIATETRRLKELIRGFNAELLDTRKTTPGLRSLEKYAVRVGGARNHRLRLDDGVLIKNNHLRLAGGIQAAVERARRGRPKAVPIEVEVRSVLELDQAIAAGAAIVLLDNMMPREVRECVERAQGRVKLEVSGGINGDNIRAYAETGVDYISAGILTHSAPAVSIHFLVEPL